VCACVPLDPSPPLIVAGKGQKHPSAIGSGDKSQITILACCNAAGYAMPPLVLNLNQSTLLERSRERCMASQRRAGLMLNYLNYGLAITF